MRRLLTVILLPAIAAAQGGMMPGPGVKSYAAGTLATFSHFQGVTNTAGSAGSVTSCNMTMPFNAPNVGDVVSVGIVMYSVSSTAPTGFTVADGNSNSYTVTANSPTSAQFGAGGSNFFAWVYLAEWIATGTPSATVNISWTNAKAAACWADEFIPMPAGVATFDKDVAGTLQTLSGSTLANVPSISPTSAGSLLYSVGIDLYNALVAPTALDTSLSPWVGTTGGPESTNSGGNTEFDLAATGSTAVKYTAGGATDEYFAMAMAFSMSGNQTSSITLGNQANIGSPTSGTSISSTHVASGGTHPALYVDIQSETFAPTGCTYNGVSMTQLFSIVDSDGVDFNTAYILKGNAAGSHSIVCSFASSTSAAYIFSADFAGVNQTTPNRTCATATDGGVASTPATVTVSNASSGDLVVASVTSGTALTLTPNNINLQWWSHISGVGITAGLSFASATGSTVMSTGLGAAHTWAIGGCALIPG